MEMKIRAITYVLGASECCFSVVGRRYLLSLLLDRFYCRSSRTDANGSVQIIFWLVVLASVGPLRGNVFHSASLSDLRAKPEPMLHVWLLFTA